MSDGKTVVCYFSGTGNSLAIARRVSLGLGGAEKLNIALLRDDASLLAARRIVVVFPVYMWGLPRIVRSFFENLRARPDEGLWAIAAHGGLAGDPIGMIRAIGRRRGFTLESGFIAWTPENFVVRYPMWPAWLNRLAIRHATGKADGIVARILAGKKGRYERSPIPITGILSLLHRYLMRRIYVDKAITADSFFRVTDACVSCDLCRRVCPKGNISIVGGRPVWGSDCEICVACLQWCPARAIQAGSKTIGRGRYHHPEIAVGDMTAR